MKKIIFIIFISLIIYYLHTNYSKQPNMVLSFGNIDAEYNYSYNNTRITDIINIIKNNIKIKDRYIQNLLIKATYIYIDLNNLIECDDYQCAQENIDDFESLIILIRKYCKEKIIIKIVNIDNDINYYINQKLMIRLKKYDIMFMR